MYWVYKLHMFKTKGLLDQIVLDQQNEKVEMKLINLVNCPNLHESTNTVFMTEKCLFDG